MTIIETSGLSREYASYRKPEGLKQSIQGFFRRQYDTKVALKPCSFSIGSGQVVGLVGANGAGKTTLLKLLSGLISPSHGDARVLGYCPWERSNEYLRRISILLGQKNQLWWDLAPVDSYQLLGSIYEIDKSEVRRRVGDLAAILKCEEQLTTQLRRLSLGERMKMELIGSLLHRPEVLFLDEPTIGLDIVAQSTIRKFIAEYVAEFRPTIILTSHYMDDISRLADRLLLISQGEIVYDGTVAGFTSASDPKQKLFVRFQAPLPDAFSLADGQTYPPGTEWFELEVE